MHHDLCQSKIFLAQKKITHDNGIRIHLELIHIPRPLTAVNENTTCTRKKMVFALRTVRRKTRAHIKILIMFFKI